MPKIGLEPDPVEDLERNLLRAIGVAFKAQFSGEGDPDAELKKVQQLSQERLDLEATIEPMAA